MKYIVFLISFFLFSFLVQAQKWQQAYMNEDNLMYVKEINPPEINLQGKSNLSQMTGFPVAVTGNASFKNMRNLTLADINGDSITDIVFAANSMIYVYSSQGILWQQPLVGTAIYPPSVADINNDGYPEIVQLTGGSPSNGRIFVFDHNGTILPGWPVNFSNHWMICAPVLTDLDDDGILEIIACERITTTGNIQVLRVDGTSFSSNWPVTLDGVPAVTPSVADVDNDGEKEIVACSTKSLYILKLDGTSEAGFPVVTDPLQKYSYQSPVIADLDNDNLLEIVGATHGDDPKYYVTKNNGTIPAGWPVDVPDDNWTYSTPTIVKINDNWKIFMSRPVSDTPSDMLYCWDINGSLQPGFPIVKAGGLEGYSSIADINNDDVYDLVFGSNLLDTNGYGFIHAFSIENGNELSNFPLRPRGWTFMNGVCIGDVNGDDQMDLVALSYTNSFGASTDSVYINVYELNVPSSPSKILWGTYKGSNTRTGFAGDIQTEIKDNPVKSSGIEIYPNPVNNFVKIQWNATENSNITILISDISGRTIYQNNIGSFPVGKCSYNENFATLTAGCYFLTLQTAGKIIGREKIIKTIIE